MLYTVSLSYCSIPAVCHDSVPPETTNAQFKAKMVLYLNSVWKLTTFLDPSLPRKSAILTVALRVFQA